MVEFVLLEDDIGVERVVSIEEVKFELQEIKQQKTQAVGLPPYISQKKQGYNRMGLVKLPRFFCACRKHLDFKSKDAVF